MHSRPTPSSLLALLVMGLITFACGPETWESGMAAGRQAMQQKNFVEAERIFTATLVQAESFGRKDPRVALTLTGLAQAHQAQKDYAQAEPLYLRALKIMQEVKGREDPSVAAILNNLGVLNRLHGQYPDAEPQLERALAIKEKVYGPEHPEVALTLNNLAQLYTAQGLYPKATIAFERALAILEKAYGPDHVKKTTTLKSYQAMLKKSRVSQPESAK